MSDQGISEMPRNYKISVSMSVAVRDKLEALTGERLKRGFHDYPATFLVDVIDVLGERMSVVPVGYGFLMDILP